MRALGLLLFAVSTGCHGVAAAPAAAASGCGSATTSVTCIPLVSADGDAVYVEPIAIAADPDGLLLALGFPTYHWLHGGPDAGSLGALIDGSGRAQLVPPPAGLASQISDIRLRAAGPGTWDAIVAFVRERDDPFAVAGDTIVRLVEARFANGKWKDLREIPLPPRPLLRAGRLSEAIHYDDDKVRVVAQAVSYDSDTGIVVFSRMKGVWSHELVPIRTPAYVALGGKSAEWLAVVAANADLPADENSLFLYHADSAPTSRIIVSAGAHGAVHEPRFAEDRTRQLTWLVRRRDQHPVWVARSAQVDSSGDLDVIEIDLGATSILTVSDSGTAVWIAEHRGRETAALLRVIARHDERGRRCIRDYANPFSSRLGAVMTTNDSAALIGGVRGDGNSEPPVASVMMRFGVHCD